MGVLQEFTEQQARLDRAFHCDATCCSVRCEACQRVYFVTSPGHGDYEDEELERLRDMARRSPDRYIEVHDFGSVSFMHLNGKQVVVGCLCDPTKPLSEWIESHASELTAYLRDYWQAVLTKSERAARDAKENLRAVGETDGND